MNQCGQPRQPRPLRQRTDGFGLLEAIVALALLGGTGLALFSWIQQNLQTASRLDTAERESRLLLSAQAFAETLNPLVKPEGLETAGNIELSWRSQLAEPVRRNQNFGGQAQGRFELGLFRMDLVARDLATGVTVRFEQYQTGWRRDAETVVAPP